MRLRTRYSRQQALASQRTRVGCGSLAGALGKQECPKVTKSKKQQIVPESSAGVFLVMAQQYHQAATKLASLGSDADSPLYFLYTHAIELALKAYLRSQGPSAPRTHSLSVLLKKSRQLGLSASLD